MSNRISYIEISIRLQEDQDSTTAIVFDAHSVLPMLSYRAAANGMQEITEPLFKAVGVAVKTYLEQQDRASK